MRRARRVASEGVFAVAAILAAATLATFGAHDAQAAECTNPLINSCINSDTYWPNPGPMRFVAVGGTETVARGQVAFGLVATYLSRPVLLRVASPGPGGSDQYVVDNQINGNFLFGYGLTERLQLDFGLPVTFVQSGAGTSPITGGRGLRDTAVRDLRFGFAYTLLAHPRTDAEEAAGKLPLGIAARMHVAAPTGDRADFAGERTAVFAPALAFDYRLSRLFFGAELEGRVRPITEFAGARIGTQIIPSLGVGFDVLPRDRLSVMLEGRALVNLPEQHETLQSAFGIRSTGNGKHITPAEWMLSARSAPVLGGDVAFQVGGGGPIPLGDEAITTPRFRFVLGVVYAPTQRDSDGDGIPDRIDPCPARAGERSGDRAGCPREENHP